MKSEKNHGVRLYAATFIACVLLLHGCSGGLFDYKDAATGSRTGGDVTNQLTEEQKAYVANLATDFQDSGKIVTDPETGYPSFAAGACEEFDKKLNEKGMRFDCDSQENCDEAKSELDYQLARDQLLQAGIDPYNLQYDSLEDLDRQLEEKFPELLHTTQSAAITNPSPRTASSFSANMRMSSMISNFSIPSDPTQDAHLPSERNELIAVLWCNLIDFINHPCLSKPQPMFPYCEEKRFRPMPNYKNVIAELRAKLGLREGEPLPQDQEDAMYTKHYQAHIGDINTRYTDIKSWYGRFAVSFGEENLELYKYNGYSPLNEDILKWKPKRILYQVGNEWFDRYFYNGSNNVDLLKKIHSTIRSHIYLYQNRFPDYHPKIYIVGAIPPWFSWGMQTYDSYYKGVETLNAILEATAREYNATFVDVYGLLHVYDRLHEFLNIDAPVRKFYLTNMGRRIVAYAIIRAIKNAEGVYDSSDPGFIIDNFFIDWKSGEFHPLTPPSGMGTYVYFQLAEHIVESTLTASHDITGSMQTYPIERYTGNGKPREYRIWLSGSIPEDREFHIKVEGFSTKLDQKESFTIQYELSYDPVCIPFTYICTATSSIRGRINY